MKKVLSLLGFSLILFACSPTIDNPDPVDSKAEINLKGTPETIEVSSEGDKVTITFSTNKDWTATSNSLWISLSPSKGTAGDASVVATVEENKTEDERGGSITISAGNIKKEINISQEKMSLSVKLKGSWEAEPYVEGFPENLIFLSGDKGYAYDRDDFHPWFGLRLFEPTDFVYSVDNNNGVTLKLITGDNINGKFSTNYYGDPIINMADGSFHYKKISESTTLPESDKQDDPFVEVVKIIDCTDGSIKVQCEIVNPRILDVGNVRFSAVACLSGSTLERGSCKPVSIKDISNNTYECIISSLDQLTEYDVYAAVMDDAYGYSLGKKKLTCTTKQYPSWGDAPLNLQGNAVDLGLPSGTLWADRNVGSAAMASNGAYFMWGDTKESGRLFSPYYEDNDDTLLENGIIDSKGRLTASYDAATQNWGKEWRLPSQNDFYELVNYCKFKNIDDDEYNVHGIIAISEINGEEIFFPRAGYRDMDGLQRNQKEGYYLSSSSYSNTSDRYSSNWEFGFCYLYFSTTNINVKHTVTREDIAYCVRPVRSK